LGQPRGAEEIRLELASRFGEVGRFEGSVDAVPGVVDQRLHRTVPVCDPADGGHHRRFVGDVELKLLAAL
jgi:hypothetical protein